MAVPKKKTSKSRRNMRRSHNAIGVVNAIMDKTTGEYRLRHHIDHDGTYNFKDKEGVLKKRQVLTVKTSRSE